MSVDVSDLVAEIRALGLEAVTLAADDFADMKREDGSWSSRVHDGIDVAGITEAGDTFVATVTEDDDIGLGEMYDNGPLPARDIYPVNKQALYWEGAEHPVKKVHWPGTAKHVGWWTNGAQEQWDAALSSALG